jgi:hypothetical protein
MVIIKKNRMKKQKQKKLPSIQILDFAREYMNEQKEKGALLFSETTLIEALIESILRYLDEHA